jgi:hypothetical protein
MLRCQSSRMPVRCKTSVHLLHQILATCMSQLPTRSVTQKCLKMMLTLLIGIIQKPILGATVMTAPKSTRKKNFFVKSQPLCKNFPVAPNHTQIYFPSFSVHPLQFSASTACSFRNQSKTSRSTTRCIPSLQPLSAVGANWR